MSYYNYNTCITFQCENLMHVYCISQTLFSLINLYIGNCKYIQKNYLLVHSNLIHFNLNIICRRYIYSYEQ